MPSRGVALNLELSSRFQLEPWARSSRAFGGDAEWELDVAIQQLPCRVQEDGTDPHAAGSR